MSGLGVDQRSVSCECYSRHRCRPPSPPGVKFTVGQPGPTYRLIYSPEALLALFDQLFDADRRDQVGIFADVQSLVSLVSVSRKYGRPIGSLVGIICDCSCDWFDAPPESSYYNA